MHLKILRWPYPYRWAFSITDDTDCSTLRPVKAVYDYLIRKGLKGTKTVWVREPARGCGEPERSKPIHGISLEDPRYVEYCRKISRHGIELCMHDVSSGNNRREEIQAAFAKFEEAFGYAPRIHIFHSHNADHIYWGENQFESRLARWMVRLMTGKRRYSGEDPESPYYWSDICRENISYIRLYRTTRFNVLKDNPSMPYHQEGKPDVKFWFSASGTGNRLDELDNRAIDRLAREDGAYLLYAYASQMVLRQNRTRLNPSVKSAFDRIADRQDCWAATASELLDRCLAIKSLVVQSFRHGWVIANPSTMGIPSLQFQCSLPVLYQAGGAEVLPDELGRFSIDDLGPGQCLPLYRSRELAEVGDLGGISVREQLWMMLREFWHLAHKRPYQLRRRITRKLYAPGKVVTTNR